MYQHYKELYWSLVFKHTPNVEDALRAQMGAFADEVIKSGAAYPWDIIDGGLRDALIGIHTDAGVVWANDTKKQLQRQGVKFELAPQAPQQQKSVGVEKKAVTEEEFLAWIKEYFETYLLDKSIIEISNTTRKEILLLMEKAIDNGWGADKLAREIRNSGIAIIRARAIARTEVGRAMNTGAMIAAASGNSATRKKWVSARDNRTRRLPQDQFDHVSMDGTFAEFDQPFLVPGKNGNEAISYPQSPDGSAGNVINCRCMNTFKVVRNEDGDILTPEQHNPRIVQNEFYKIVRKPIVVAR